MTSKSADKLYTCRYFAYGPACPNFDTFDRNVCSFAHWDTGRVASHFQQRGTCMTWKILGYCGRGAGCWYEHRLTGVTGLYQGTIELTGFELQVADAASKAGFNTLNHEALFDLIWAVKKLAMRVGGGQLNPAPPVPRDPIYPDRYRPSGIGDNTNTKKRRKAMAKRQFPVSSVEPKVHPVQPLMRKRNLKSRAQDDLIDFPLSDEEITMDMEDTPSSGPKRQKISFGMVGQHTADTTSAKLNNYHNGMTQATNVLVKTNKALDLAGGRRSGSEAVRDRPTQITPMVSTTTAEAGIIKQMLLVKTKLEDTRRTMNTCQSTMKTLFDLHHEKFDHDATMVSLRKLSDSMNKAFDGGKEGAAEIDKVVAWLNGKEDVIL